MLQQIHMQNQLLLHLEYEIELEGHQILHVDPMPIIIKSCCTSFSHTIRSNLLE